MHVEGYLHPADGLLTDGWLTPAENAKDQRPDIIITYMDDEGFPHLILEVCCSFEHQNLENINQPYLRKLRKYEGIPAKLTNREPWLQTSYSAVRTWRTRTKSTTSKHTLREPVTCRCLTLLRRQLF